jgi:GrpB-like predicted nucleotidyltransferase (UPF0157 family)
MAIIVAPYNPDWKNQFQQLKDQIWPKIGNHCKAMEHVGSTAVAGLAAKPVIDVDIIIKNESKFIFVKEALGEIGYEHRGNLGIEGREAFRCLNATFAHHLYVCFEGSLALKNHLLLRDHLRANPTDRDAYAKLKMELAKKYVDDMDSYVDGKTDFILNILAKYDFAQNELKEMEKVNRK